jgi:hypothetical protein
MALSVTPCCAFDDCRQDHTSATTEQADNGVCSPFFSCTTCPGFTSTASSPVIVAGKPVYDNKPFSRYFNRFTACYFGKFWQPPKIA